MIAHMDPDSYWELIEKPLTKFKCRKKGFCNYCHMISVLYFYFVIMLLTKSILAEAKQDAVQTDALKQKITDNQVRIVDDDEYFDEEDIDDYQTILANTSAKGVYIGGPCDEKCNDNLHHVYCDSTTNKCTCEKNYPVIIAHTKGCAKPKRLGEQCFYHQTCMYNDANSLCVQVKHNAMCQCSSGYHSVTYTKPIKRVFCTQDMAVLTSDLPTLLGVSTGIAVLAGLICMVLHLFSKTKIPRHRNFADASIPPPIMYSTDTVHSGRPSSRESIHSSNSMSSLNRRPSSAPHSGSKGILVSASRSGSRRPSLASINSTSSSIRSYSAMRFEKEIQQKELRQEMKLKLVRLQQQQHKPHLIIGDPLLHTTTIKTIMTTSNPITPNSTDELLPAVDEVLEISPPLSIHADSSYIGPCSSNEALLD